MVRATVALVMAWAVGMAPRDAAAAASLPVGDTAPDIAGYRAKIEPLLETFCLDCHDDATKKGELSLEGLDANLITGKHFETWRMIDEQVRFGDMPPKKKAQPSEDQRKLLLAWIRGELLKTQLPGVVTHEKLRLPKYGNYVDHRALFEKRLDRVYPAAPRIWRLRPSIYGANMPRLAERVSGLANGLNMHDGSEIKDYAASYFLDEASTTPLLGNAKKIAERMVSPQSKDRAFKQLVGDAAPDEKTVRDAVATAFRKVLQRKPTASESQRFLAFYAKAKASAGHVTAGKALLTAVLMQPEVLYRQELGDGKPDRFGRVRLTQVEIAYALSYALEDRPIDTFLKAAAAGNLANAEQIAGLVGSQLQDDSLLQSKNPRVLQFFREYFHYPFSREVFKDQPKHGKHEASWLVDDLETTLRDVLREDKQVLATLLTTRKYHVNAHYAQNKKNKIVLMGRHHKWWPYQTTYSLPLDWKWALHLQPVTFRKEERAGVLTHPAWLTAWSGNFENHPVQRGKWVRTNLLGGTVPDVPIGVDARVPEMENTSFRDRLQATTRAAECWRCHKKMDPLGVVFERYDHYGRYQRLDAGQPVDASGLIDRTGVASLDGAKVSGPTEMVEKLAGSKHVEQVFIRYLFRYFLGRNETLGDANTLQDAHEAYRKSDGSLRAVIISLLASDSFLYRQSDRDRQ